MKRLITCLIIFSTCPFLTAAEKTIQQWSVAEWSVKNPSHEGNPFDVIAKVHFMHHESGEKRTTEMFHVGADTWDFRFNGTTPGQWHYTTQCDGKNGSSNDPELHNMTGSVTVKPPSNPSNGFITAIGNKWGWSGTGRAFIPQFVMGKELDYFYDFRKKQVDAEKIDAEIREFVDEHGFTGFHIHHPKGWFNLEGKVGKDPNPDPRSYDVLETLILQVHERGGACHIWMWGSDGKSKGEGPRFILSGPMCEADQRNLRYFAARLGALPGWSMGYGFDTENLWAHPDELDAWKEFLESRMGWDHFLGARVGYDEKGLWGRYGDRSKARLNKKFNAPIGDDYLTWAGGDYIGYTSYRPLYDRYVEAIQHQPDRPSFEEDRFRLRNRKEWFHKDYSPEMTIKGLWHSAMAGGAANIWGNLLPRDNHGGSQSYNHGKVQIKSLIKTYAVFFRDKKRFRADFIRDNSIADPRVGTTEIPKAPPISVCLRNPANTHFVFYKEDASSVGMNLGAMNGSQPAIAVDTRKPYAEVKIGPLQPSKHSWKPPYKSTWAIAVGKFE